MRFRAGTPQRRSAPLRSRAPPQARSKQRASPTRVLQDLKTLRLPQKSRQPLPLPKNLLPRRPHPANLILVPNAGGPCTDGVTAATAATIPPPGRNPPPSGSARSAAPSPAEPSAAAADGTSVTSRPDPRELPFQALRPPGIRQIVPAPVPLCEKSGSPPFSVCWADFWGSTGCTWENGAQACCA